MRRAAARDPRRGGGLSGRPSAPEPRLGWDPAPSRAGSRRTSPPSSRAWAIAWVEVDGRPVAEPGAGPPPPARPLRPLLRRPRDPHARAADPLGLPRLLPPDRPRPRPHPHPGRAAGARPPPRRRLQQPRPARRRADDRHRRDRGRAARLRRRSARGPPLHPRLGAGRVARRAGPASWRRGRW